MVTIVRDRIADLLQGGATIDQVKAARPTLDYDRRYRAFQWSVHDGDVHQGNYQDLVAPARRGAQVMVGAALRLCVAVAGLGLWLSGLLQAQAPQPAAAPASPQSIAPIDLVGTWVSVVSEDWRWRMLTPAKGDYASLPLTDAGRKAADSWDFQASQTPENACKPFGVGNIMRMPGRLRISWQGAATLKLEFDAGSQTRLLNFSGAPPTGEPSWQGYSVAAWEIAGQSIEVDRNGIPVAPAGGGRGRGISRRRRPGTARRRAARDHDGLQPGFLRKNGVPYSDKASIVGNFDRISYPNGDQVLLVRTTIEDPQYLQGPFITSTHFKREPSDAKWKATPCAIDPPVERPGVIR